MIPIQNIYYMLSYAFQILNEQGYKNIATEQFNNTAELMAAILEKGIAIQLKRGLGKEYIPQTMPVEGKSFPYVFNIGTGCPWTSLFKKSLIDENKLEFMALSRSTANSTNAYTDSCSMIRKTMQVS